MFGFFKKKNAPVPSVSDVLKLEDRDFVNTVARMITEGPLASGTMCLIANENLRPIVDVTFALAKKKPEQGLPEDLDSFARYLANGIERQADEIGRRRMQWFFLACLIWRANAKAATDPTLIEPVAAIWLFLSKSGELLQETIAQNRLWEEKEKVWFDHIRTPNAGISYVLVHMLPSFLKKHEKIRALAEEHDVFLSAVPGRMA